MRSPPPLSRPLPRSSPSISTSLKGHVRRKVISGLLLWAIAVLYHLLPGVMKSWTVTRTILFGTFVGQDLTPAFARGSDRARGGKGGRAREGEECVGLRALGNAGIPWGERIFEKLD